MLDVGGQDSTEAFEDVGHSDEAREILEGLLVGKLKRQVRFYLLPSSLCFALPRISPGTLLSPQNPILRPDFYFRSPLTAIRILTPPKGRRPQAQELRAARRLVEHCRRRIDRRRPVRHHPYRRRARLRRLEVPPGTERGTAVDKSRIMQVGALGGRGYDFFLRRRGGWCVDTAVVCRRLDRGRERTADDRLMHFFSLDCRWAVCMCVCVCVWANRGRDPGGEIWGVGNGCVFAAVADTDTSVYPAPNDEDDGDGDGDGDDDSDTSDPSTTLHTTRTTNTNPVETAAHRQLSPFPTSTSISTHPYRLISRDILSRPTHRRIVVFSLSLATKRAGNARLLPSRSARLGCRIFRLRR
jgi:hypothetical protein